MLKIIFLVVCILSCLGICWKPHHLFWLTSPKATIQLTDKAWNYCDEKCLYLEKYVKDVDFVVVHFKDTPFKPSFAACYGKTRNGSYEIWNKLIQNDYYEKLCGGDHDWLSRGYEISNVVGVGRGT